MEITLPAGLADEIEHDVTEFRKAKLEEVLPFYTDQTMLVWRSTDPHPPTRSSPAKVYSGDMASGYDAKREQSPKWQFEQQVVEDMLSDLPAESYVLDCPVGTGRFLDYYMKKGFWVHAVDLSMDMLKQAHAKCSDRRIHFAQADIRDLGLWDDAVDAVVVCRLTRWLDPTDCQRMFREMQRIARKRVIFTCRVQHPRSDLSRPMQLFHEAQLPGWRLTRMTEMPSDPDYRVVMFEYQTQQKELSDEEE